MTLLTVGMSGYYIRNVMVIFGSSRATDDHSIDGISIFEKKKHQILTINSYYQYISTFGAQTWTLIENVVTKMPTIQRVIDRVMLDMYLLATARWKD